MDNNPRIFYATTRDFETFSDPALLFDPNYSVKDAVLLNDGNRLALLHNDNTTPMQNLRSLSDEPGRVRGDRRATRLPGNSLRIRGDPA